MTAPYATPYYSTQGLQLYGLNALTSPSSVMTMAASMGFTGLGGAADDINITNLDSPGYKEFAKGLIDPGTPGGDVVYNFTNTTHQWLSTMLAQGQNATTQWFIGAADAASTVVPGITGTIASGNQVLHPPNSGASPKTYTRSGWYFYAYVKEFSWDTPVNSFVKAKLKLRVSGAITVIVKGASATIV